MNNLHFSQEQLVQVAKLSDADMALIDECRGEQNKSLEEITSSGNCTTLIMAAIIYWQAREISRIVKEYNPEEDGIDISLLAHISPIEWSNVVLYGE
jgi:hypothetical protein